MQPNFAFGAAMGAGLSDAAAIECETPPETCELASIAVDAIAGEKLTPTSATQQAITTANSVARSERERDDETESLPMKIDTFR